jgi:hypothetical protein
MKKTMILAAIVSSVWFTPVTWVAGAWLGVQAICMQEQCRRSYAPRQEAVEQFTVLVVMPAAEEEGQKRLMGIPLAELHREISGDAARSDRIVSVPYGYFFGDPSFCSLAFVPVLDAAGMSSGDWGAALLLPVMSGTASRGFSVAGGPARAGWDFSAMPGAPGSQTVSLRSENMAFKYRTDGVTIQPISSQIMDIRYLWIGALSGVVLENYKDIPL